MTTKWSHLPNAVDIDWVVSSARSNPNTWVEVWDATALSVKNEAWDSAKHTVELSSRNEAWGAAWRAVIGSGFSASDAARYVIIALIAWDDCTHLLDSEPEHVKLLAALGVPAAILLYPACVVLSKERELA